MKAVAALLSLLIFAISNVARGDTFGSGDNVFDIAFTTIGNPGNPADTTGSPNPAGSVPYIYRMGIYEISQQMVFKANALGGLNIATGNSDKPVYGISWNQAARFVNWLNTSTGNKPAYQFLYQPGQVFYQSNQDIILWSAGQEGYNSSNRYRNSLAKYFLPDVDEWYKAAYYDPTSGVYYDYPTGSDTHPTSVASGTTAGTAVYNQHISQGGPADITQAGGLSPYGTMAQGGNVSEWNETSASLFVPAPSDNRLIRGGDASSFIFSPSGNSPLSSSNGIGFNRMSSPSAFGGFRVASIPEPSSALLAVSIFALLVGRRSRRNAMRPRSSTAPASPQR